MNRAEEQFRIERDPLGEARVPAGALYGIQTKRRSTASGSAPCA